MHVGPLSLVLSTMTTPSETPPTGTPSTPSGVIDTPKSKKIYLIRHAESEENRRISAFCRTFRSLKKFSLPKSSDVSTSIELLNVSAQVDSDVSETGAKQIAHMGEKLRKASFVESSGIELVVHSPLKRARQTSEGMLGCMAASSSDGPLKEKRSGTVSKVAETALLLEKTPAEWTPIYYNAFLKRISEFEDWLGEQPEETIALVGHSQFFKAMLGLTYKFGNCEVWEVDFDSSSTQDGMSQDATANTSGEKIKEEQPSFSTPRSRWSNLVKLHHCEIESSPRIV